MSKGLERRSEHYTYPHEEKKMSTKKYKIKATNGMGYGVYLISQTITEGLLKEIYIGEFSSFALAKEYVELKGGVFEQVNQWGETK